MISAPILTYLDFSTPFVLQLDGCKNSIGAVLFQVQKDNKEHPIAYWSRTLSDAERHYSTPEQECLALFSSMKHFRLYLWGKEFLVHVDHQSLLWLYQTKETKQTVSLVY